MTRIDEDFQRMTAKPEFQFTLRNVLTIIVGISFFLAVGNMFVFESQRTFSSDHYFFWPTRTLGRMDSVLMQNLRTVFWGIVVGIGVCIVIRRQSQPVTLLAFCFLTCFSLNGYYMFYEPHGFWNAFNYQRMEQIILCQIILFSMIETVARSLRWDAYLLWVICCVVCTFDWLSSCEYTLNH